MNLFRRAQGEDPDVFTLIPHSTEWRQQKWSSMVKRVLMIVIAAFQSQSASALLSLATCKRVEDIEVALSQTIIGGSAASSSASSSKGLRSTNLPTRKSNVTWVRGRVLYRTNAPEPIRDPATCTHVKILDGGNAHMQWETCVWCGTRWERIPLDIRSEPQEVNKAQTISLPGKAWRSCRSTLLAVRNASLP